MPVSKSRNVLVPSGALSLNIPENEMKTTSRKNDSIVPDGVVSADLAKSINLDGDARQDETAASSDVPLSQDADVGDVSSDKSVRKSNVRIITENGVVSLEDAPTEESDGGNDSAE
jgi:hypothetical protein